MATRRFFLLRFTPGVISDQVLRNPKQPRCERRACPFELRKIRESLMENVTRQVLRRRSIAHPPRHVRVNDFEILFINVSKPRAIALSRFNQKPLIRPVWTNFLYKLAVRHWL